jgi:hypothetical protein
VSRCEQIHSTDSTGAARHAQRMFGQRSAVALVRHDFRQRELRNPVAVEQVSRGVHHGRTRGMTSPTYTPIAAR